MDISSSYNTRSKSHYQTPHQKRRPRKRIIASSSDEESDIDEYGNIKDLIDYSFTEDKCPRKPRKSRKKRKRPKRSKRVQRKLSFSSTSDSDYEEPHEEPDELMTKMLVLQQLCKHVEHMKRADRDEFDEEYDVYCTASESSDDDYFIPRHKSSKKMQYTKHKKTLCRKLTTAERKYYKNLSGKERHKFEKKNAEIDLFNETKVPLKFKILGLPNISTQSKSHLLSRLQTFQNMEQSDNEYHKLKSWFNEFTKIPLNTYAQFPISIETSSPEKICDFLKESRSVLDAAVYGHEPVKNEVIQVISQWITNPKSKGNVLALQGPMGNGKTTLAKNGLAKVLKRPFALIALGGAKDSSFLNGHEYTFEGSKCGRIVEVLRELQCMNPIIFFDELDKLSDTPTGQEISNLLCHITDPVQNSEFHDRYFSGIDFDLSKAIFVMSFNDESKINSILKDRMHVVRMKGFQPDDKIKIARQYLIPSICDELQFDTENVTLSDEALRYIITTYTSEEGVRSFRRCLKMIYSKLNVLHLLSQSSEDDVQNIISFTLDTKTFPVEMTIDRIRSLLTTDESKSNSTSVEMMYL